MEQAQTSDRHLQRRAASLDLLWAAAPCLLFMSLFLGWFRHEEASQLHGLGILFPTQNGNLLIVLSGWDSSKDVGAISLVLAGIALGQLLTGRLGFREFGPFPSLIVAAGGALASAMLAHLIVSPPETYTHPQPGVYAALGAAIFSTAAGIRSAQLRGARLSSFDWRELQPGAVIAAFGGVIVLVTMSLGWYGGRKFFSGSMPGYTPPDSLSPWAADDWVAYPLAAIALAAIGLCIARSFRAPRHFGLASIGLAIGGCVAAILVLIRIDDPHSAVRNLYLFNQPTSGIYLSLAGCLAVVAGAVWSLLALPDGKLGTEWRTARLAAGAASAGDSRPIEPAADGRRLPAPLVAGSILSLVLAALSLWVAPLVALTVVAGFALGFALRRWWLLFVPWLIALPLAYAWYANNPCSGESSECLNFLVYFYAIAAAAYVCVAVAIGIIARRLSDRTGQLRPRSSA